MFTIDFTALKRDLNTYLDTVTDNRETMIVTRKHHKNVVVLSEETYDNMMENLYLKRDPANYNWLMESKKQLESGHCSHHDILDVKEYQNMDED